MPPFPIYQQGLDSFCHQGTRVPYFRGKAAWVSAGLPPHNVDAFAQAFCQAASASGARASFFGLEPQHVLQLKGYRTVTLGWQGFWDPLRWPEVLASSSSLRAQIRRARRKDVVVRKLSQPELLGAWGLTVDALARQWSARREMAPLGFVVRLPASLARTACLSGCQVWAAIHQTHMVAVAVLMPQADPRDWVLHHLLRLPTAPNGSNELLVDSAFSWLAQLQHDRPYDKPLRVSLGMAPLFGETNFWLRLVARVTAGLFNFRGLHRFKEKLRPHQRQPVMVAFDPQVNTARKAVADVLRAFADDRAFRFAGASLGRAPRLLIHVLAWLLIPWTTLLALAPRAWFPSPKIKALWIAFDVGLAAGFFIWRKRHRYIWLLGLASVVGVDAVLTTAQVAMHNLHLPWSLGHTVASAVALAGPWLAFVLLVVAACRLVPRPGPAAPPEPPTPEASPAYDLTHR